MSALHRLLAVCLMSAVAASGCASATDGGVRATLHPSWLAQMAAGLDSSDQSDLARAAGHYRSALRLARDERLPEEELAFSSYRLGEAIRVRPETSRGETALALLDESRRHFEAAYGAHHPVLIPVWLRIAATQADVGNDEAAAAARVAADRIAVRSFPEHHFLRERYGLARPATLLHPLEMLSLVEARTREAKQIVQGQFSTRSGIGQNAPSLKP